MEELYNLCANRVFYGRFSMLAQEGQLTQNEASEFLPDQVATPGAAADENSQRRQSAPAGLRGPPWRYHVAAEGLHSHALANHLLVPNENFRFYPFQNPQKLFRVGRAGMLLF